MSGVAPIFAGFGSGGVAAPPQPTFVYEAINIASLGQPSEIVKTTIGGVPIYTASGKRILHVHYAFQGVTLVNGTPRDWRVRYRRQSDSAIVTSGYHGYRQNWNGTLAIQTGFYAEASITQQWQAGMIENLAIAAPTIYHGELHEGSAVGIMETIHPAIEAADAVVFSVPGNFFKDGTLYLLGFVFAADEYEIQTFDYDVLGTTANQTVTIAADHTLANVMWSALNVSNTEVLRLRCGQDGVQSGANEYSRLTTRFNGSAASLGNEMQIGLATSGANTGYCRLRHLHSTAPVVMQGQPGQPGFPTVDGNRRNNGGILLSGTTGVNTLQIGRNAATSLNMTAGKLIVVSYKIPVTVASLPMTGGVSEVEIADPGVLNSVVVTDFGSVNSTLGVQWGDVGGYTTAGYGYSMHDQGLGFDNAEPAGDPRFFLSGFNAREVAHWMSVGCGLGQSWRPNMKCIEDGLTTGSGSNKARYGNGEAHKITPKAWTRQKIIAGANFGGAAQGWSVKYNIPVHV